MIVNLNELRVIKIEIELLSTWKYSVDEKKMLRCESIVENEIYYKSISMRLSNNFCRR